MNDNYGFAISDNSRIQKAEKIISSLEYSMNQKLQNKKILEVGAGSGLISYALSNNENHVIAIDVQDSVFKETLTKRNILQKEYVPFLLADGTQLPFVSKSFDVVICNQMIEHISKKRHEQLLEEFYRVLKVKGLLYLSTGNKLWPIEPHAHLPFLSFLPHRFADRYIKKYRGLDTYNVQLLTYMKLKSLLSMRFQEVIDLTSIMAKDPNKFHINELNHLLNKMISKVPTIFLRLSVPLFPGWIMIAKKTEE